MRDIVDNAGVGGGSDVMEENEGDANGAAEGDMDDCGSLALPPDIPPYSGDYIISDYMERLGTRLNILETELKYAWRALDLLSQEYVRMWERLERLEALLADQQGVISTLLDFYTCRSVAGSSDPITRLEVIREILGNGSIEDGIEEGLEIGNNAVLIDSQDELMESDEAFYKSLNQAYRDDLVCEENSRPQSQLDMIWEAPEETDLEILPSGSRQIYSATDYKDYRSLQDAPCISDRDLAHLSTLSTIDQITVDKLHELDRLSSQLHKDSRELKDLKTRLLSPEKKKSTKQERDIEAKTLVEDGNIINEQLKNVYSGGDNWGINDMMKTFDEFMLAMPKENVNQKLTAEKSPSRLSLIDNVPPERVDYFPPTISPRRKFVPERTSTEPYTTVTGRLAYSSAVANAEINAAKASKSPSALSRDRFDYSSYQTDPRQNYYSNKSPQQVNHAYKTRSDVHSPSLSVHEIYNEIADSRLEMGFEETRPPSPPPPAPPNGTDLFGTGDNSNQQLSRQSMLSTTHSIVPEHNRLSPRSPRSPKSSPKHLKRDSANIVAAKSDSGLSSMSGWSSLEKSPGSPKTGKSSHSSHDSHKIRMSSPQLIQRMTYEVDSKPYIETLVDSYYESSKPVNSDYNLRKNEISKIVPVSCNVQNKIDNVYLKNDAQYQMPSQISQISNVNDYYYGNEASSIYSVAGNRQPIFTTVYSTPRGILSEEINFSQVLDRNEIHEIHRDPVESYPPEPSYHANTVVMPQNKRSLTRAVTMSTSANEPQLYQNGHRPSNHRSGGYPSGHLTDALTYYPTSDRYDSPKRPSIDEQLSWQAMSRSPTSSMETSSVKSHSLNVAERKQFQNQLQQEYYKQQQYDQRNGNVLYEEGQMYEDKPKELRKEQYVDSSGILVSESGYLSISANIKHKAQDRQVKKPKRTSSLKSAVSSMSHWLPDLHLPKKHRSHSLPSGVDTVEQQQNEKSLKERILSAQRRKKKYHLVASMSGLLQKARRKHQASHQSLSDPETSETEWSGGRSSAQSEDSDSVFSDSTHENNVFAKIASKPKQRKINTQEIVEQQQKIQEMHPREMEVVTESETLETLSVTTENDKIVTGNAIPRDKSDDIDFHFARVSQINNANITELEKLDIDTDISNVDPYEEEIKESENMSPSSLFATVGDVKRANASIDEVTPDNKPYSGSGPMEFAVSRALGKYRLRKSTSISDDQLSETSPPKKDNGSQEEYIEDSAIPKERRIKSVTPEVVPVSVSDESAGFTERSPSIQSGRGLPNKFAPRHQQSLEIPSGKHEDDDSRSTHSWRSGSRVSSRRQSTEDSIDSEDEWYCYELRKLEEMEHQTQAEFERQQTLPEVPEFETEFSEEADENLKEKMSYVLRELKLKTAHVKKACDESPVKGQTWKDITTFPEIDDIDHDVEPAFDDYDQSDGSGETSGPDSPGHSCDDLDEDFDEPQLYVEPAEELPPSHDAPVGSKWKLLKALKDRKAEEKTTDTPAATTPAEKDKVSAGVSYLMQKFHEIRVKS